MTSSTRTHRGSKAGAERKRPDRTAPEQQYHTRQRYAIRWHMGYTEADTLSFNNAIDRYPMIWALHSADTQASHFMENNEGNKLAYADNGSAEYADQPTMQEATAPVFEEATPV